MRPIEGLFSKRLCFTVTSGRSRTKLLAILLREAAGLCAEHEPAPRFNYVLRAVLEYPEAAAWWLAAEKLPAIAEIARSSGTYIELSHLTCKGFVEPLLELGLRPDFLMICRPAREVATSLFRIGAVPERTGAGRLVLIGPQFSRFLPIMDWRHLTDYQLCYWYAREIEHRQAHYRSFFSDRGINWRDCTVDDMTNWNSFMSLCEFVAGEAVSPDRTKFEEILSRDQNPRDDLRHGQAKVGLPADIDEEEIEVENLIRG